MFRRRHIALFAILVSSAVMFAHVFVPHHHCADDLSICSSALGIHHGDHAAGAGEHSDEEDGECDLNHSIPSLFFILRDNDTHRLADELDNDILRAATGLAFLVVDYRIDFQYLSSEKPRRYASIDCWRESLWDPGAVRGRAPPVLPF